MTAAAPVAPAGRPGGAAREWLRVNSAGGPVPVRALCVAGLASSVGKTTLTLALVAAYRRRGLRVRCAKVAGALR